MEQFLFYRSGEDRRPSILVLRKYFCSHYSHGVYRSSGTNHPSYRAWEPRGKVMFSLWFPTIHADADKPNLHSSVMSEEYVNKGKIFRITFAKTSVGCWAKCAWTILAESGNI